MTDRQKMFCKEYLVDLNASKAAVRAGYSPKCAASQGYTLLRVPAIASRINELMLEREKRLELSTDKIVEELAAIAFSDFSCSVRLKNISGGDLTPSTSSAGRPPPLKGGEVKVSEKLRALELLGKCFGMFKDKGAQEEEEAVNPFGELTTEELKRLVENGET